MVVIQEEDAEGISIVMSSTKKASPVGLTELSFVYDHLKVCVPAVTSNVYVSQVPFAPKYNTRSSSM